MILFQALAGLAGLFLFSFLFVFICELVRKSEIKKEYNQSRCKSVLSLKEFTEKYYNRI